MDMRIKKAFIFQSRNRLKLKKKENKKHDINQLL